MDRSDIDNLRDYFDSIEDEYRGEIHIEYDLYPKVNSTNVLVSLRFPNDYVVKFSNDERINQVLMYASNYIKLLNLQMSHHVDKLKDLRNSELIKWIEGSSDYSLDRVEIYLSKDRLSSNGTIGVNFFFGK